VQYVASGFSRTRLAYAIAGSLLVAAGVSAQAPQPRIWQGVYTAAQAERGRTTFSTACVRCHGADLAGTTAPSLKGERFMTTWGGETVTRLFEKIRDTMPPNFGTILDDSTKLDIVTYILQTNGYPAGSRELAVGSELAAIQILRQGEQPKVQNFSLVQAVGCLARGDNDAWVLRSSSDPVVTTENAPTAEALAAAAEKPLGTGSFVLVSAAAFDPAAHQGQKMEARGLIYQEPGEALLTVTSLRSVGTCQS
jgi:mono/diheme cytochrome c family protein